MQVKDTSYIKGCHLAESVVDLGDRTVTMTVDRVCGLFRLC